VAHICYTCPGPDTAGNPCTCVRRERDRWNNGIEELVELSRKMLENYNPNDPVEFVWSEYKGRTMYGCDIGISP